MAKSILSKSRGPAAAAPSRSKQRAAIRALEQVAFREADAAYSATFNAICATAEMNSPALGNCRSGTIFRMIRKAFEHAVALRETELPAAAKPWTLYNGTRPAYLKLVVNAE
jgi:hypothetical protein